MNESSIPCRLSRSRMWPRQGLWTIGTIGLGRLMVRGRRRLPSPPAMTTACITPKSSWRALLRRRPRIARSGRHARRALRSTALRADGEQRLQVVPRIHLERDVRVRSGDAGDLREAAGHDVRELLVLARADHRDKIHLAGDRIDLRDAGDRGQHLAELGDGAFLRCDQDDRGDHLYRLLTSMSWSADFTK